MSDDPKDQGPPFSPVPWIESALQGAGADLVRRGLTLLNRVEKAPRPLAAPYSRYENSLGMAFVYLPPGTFMMGSPAHEPGRKDYEVPHLVVLTNGFYMQAAPVTVAQWRAFARATGHVTRAERKGGAFAFHDGRWVQEQGRTWETAFEDQTEDHPVACVSWDEAQDFARWLSLREALSYRLPTEAEWEYACRAGSTARFCFGDDDGLLGDYAWYWENSSKRSHPVGGKRPNAWGLYDMHGNIWELCEDRCEWGKEKGRVNILTDTYTVGIHDPLCRTGRYRIARGGDCLSPPRSCRAAKRLICAPKSTTTVRGFRLALNP